MPLTSHEVRFSLPHIEVAGKAWGEPGGLPVIALHGWLDRINLHDAMDNLERAETVARTRIEVPFR